jgi:ABC-2 type transport system permease protein
VITILELAAIFFLFDHIADLKGWTQWEVVYLYGVASVSLGLGEILTSGLDEMPALVREGTFDQLLIRPVSPLVQILGREMQLFFGGRVLQGLLAVGLGLHHAGATIGAPEISMLLVSVASGTLIYSALFLAAAANCFWTVESNEMFNAFTYGGVQMTQFPVSIYPAWLRRVFLFGIPVGFASYFPALKVLHKSDVLGLPALMPYLTPVVAILFALFCLRFWRFGVDHYQSTGS